MDDPGAVDYLVAVLILVLILIFEVFIYLLKAALAALPDSEAERLKNGDKKSLRKLMEKQDELVTATSFGSILLVVLFSFVTAESFLSPLADALRRAGVPTVSAGILSAVILILGAAFLLMTVAGIIPRRIGQKRPRAVLTKLSGLARVFYLFNVPAVRLAGAISSVLMRILGLRHLKEESSVSEAEILSMVTEGGKGGVIEDEQAEMIHNIFAFDDVDVSELMTHRTDVVAVEASASVEALRDLAIAEGYSRIPVYQKSIDNIVGVIYVKDLLLYINEPVPHHKKVSDLMRSPVFVPETMRCDKLFKFMTEKHIQMAIAVDEYGGTAGIITMEDLIESILGNIQDEYDEEEEEIRALSENTYCLDGTADLDDVAEELQVSFPEGDYDTIGGFLIDSLGYIPEDGTSATVQFAGFRFV
ncbi:MAG TPA: hemolysin family protein, partial [Clostridiales bacterium]|nr:hemolysin family protein [Clostridiales bacterium]